VVLPILANALTLQGTILAASNTEKAMPYLEEAIRVLAPFFVRVPQAYTEGMREIVGIYLKAIADAGKEPDEAVLATLPESFRNSIAPDDPRDGSKSLGP